MEIKSTDQSAFRNVYKECYPLLMKICYHIVYNLDIAQDLVQEAFERHYREGRIGRFAEALDIKIVG